MKCYTKRKVVGVTIEVRSHGNAERGRGAGRKSWLLKNVIITLATDPPTPALGLRPFTARTARLYALKPSVASKGSSV